jgi:hypothetical protein
VVAYVTQQRSDIRLHNQVCCHGADPFAYLKWVFEKLMHNPSSGQLEELLPVHWIKARPAAAQTIESVTA